MVSAGAADLRIDRLTRTPVVPPKSTRQGPVSTGDHDPSLGPLGAKQARQAIEVWAERSLALAVRADVAYVLVVEDRDPDAADHAGSRVYSFREVPPVPLRELTTGQCALCEAPPDQLVVCRVGGLVAWCPNASAYPYEVRIAPTEHRSGFAALGDEERDDCAAVLADVVDRFDRLFPELLPLATWWHQRPTDKGEWPLAHLHAHLNPRISSPGGAEMGSGVAFNPVAPEEAASRLRSA